jgi:hypothetical protein
MQYKITHLTQQDDSILTEVDITLESGDIITVSIAHFRPQSAEEIDNNIKNRAISEQAKISATQACSDLINTIKIGTTITI